MPHPINKMERRINKTKSDIKIVEIFIKLEPLVTVILWCAVIFYFSSIPGLKTDFKSMTDLVLRKIAHITEYFILTLLFFRTFTSSKSLNKKHAIVIAVFMAFLYAVSDEFHQVFVENRDGRILDVLVDSLGIFAAYRILKIRDLRVLNFSWLRRLF